ncbi:hypothetical protein Vadar_017045 [Vaccinium darrowii]|uniref:Uncharacterized protein n=1 Tax=Vaccinium darrowii TaxID=229202 RepID=A0ACB7ZD93_9ERIC|nr:hypothetical protein Vadar_017045 [Vaccinium darrowii]
MASEATTNSCPIKTVVVLVQENRSFDHILGWMKSLNPEIDGVTGNESNPLSTSDPNSPRVYFGDRSGYVDPDPGHSFDAIFEQVYGVPWSPSVASQNLKPTMEGFAQQAESIQEGMSEVVMNGFKPELVPVYKELVSEFAVCDRWFASMPTLTQPNRLYVHSATSYGATANDNKMMVEGYPQKTIFESVEEAGLSFGIYYQYPPSTLFYSKAVKKAKNVVPPCLPLITFIFSRLSCSSHMGWRTKDSGWDPPLYEINSGYFTIKMLIGGSFEGPSYVGGKVGWVDYCHKDELSIIELCHMATELGHTSSNDYYFKLNGEKRIVKCDQDVMGLSYLVDCDNVVQVYCVCNNIDVVATQGSQIGNLSGGACKRKRNVGASIIGKDKFVSSGLVDVQVDNEEESDEYDPDSTSSESGSDDEDFYESDDGVSDDDTMFQENVDKNIEFAGLGGSMAPSGQEYASMVDGLANLDGDSDGISSDDLKSMSGSSSDEDEDGWTGRKKAKTNYPVFNEKTDMDNPVFKIGMEFKTHEQVREAIKEYSIKWGRKIKFNKNDREKVDAVCKTGCPWHIYASYVKNEGLYRVKTYVNEHDCTREFNIPWVSTKWIIRRYYDRIRRNPTWPIPSLIETITAEWTVHVDKQKVFRAKKKALELIEGTAAQQFGQLYGYIEEVKNTNPGTTIVMKVKPIIGSETDVKFKRHMYNNFKGEFKGLVLKEILWKAARATTIPAFTKAMEEMHKAEPRAYQWLNERPAIHWSRSHFDTFPTCDILLNNLCESFNSVILSARDKPIISMLERIRIILMETIQKRHFLMSRSTNIVCPKIMKKVAKLKEYKGWIPRYSGDGQFEVVGPNNEQYRIDLEKKTCGCRRWELSGIPCVHAITGYNHLDRDMVDYIHDCYKVRTYLATYSNFLTPMNGKDMWPNEGYPTLLPPDVKKRAGRPKKARRREPEENEDPTKLSKRGMKMSCSSCGKIGHNKRGCKQGKRATLDQPAVNTPTSSGITVGSGKRTTSTGRRGKIPFKRPATVSKGSSVSKGTSFSKGSGVTNVVSIDGCGQSTSKQTPPPIRTMHWRGKNVYFAMDGVTKK